MSDSENWGKYGFPDDIFFRAPYLPWIGLVKALNERSEAVELEPLEIPEYFTQYGGMSWEADFYYLLGEVQKYYVNPDQIPTAKGYYGCFWYAGDLNNAALDGEDIENVTSITCPRYSAKWAIWTYNKINLLRYVATSKESEWPKFEYEDKYNTFKFKA